MNAKYSPLFDKLDFKSGSQLKNRIVMAPMTHSSSNQDGTVSDTELAYYIRRSAGIGMVITACTYTTPSGIGFSGQFAADRDEMIPSLRRLAEAIKGQGAKAVLQIFHGGRMCPPGQVPNGDVVSASAVPASRPGSAVPRALAGPEIEAIVRDFGETTRRAIEAGFDGVEIHGANGYLLQQFFSPHSNRRDDRWGGSLDKRMAFPLAVVEEVTRIAAEHAKQPFIIGYRFSPEEVEEDGITMADTLKLVDALAETKLDYIHVSLMEVASRPRRGADDSKSRIEWILDAVGGRLPVVGVGSIHTADDALNALNMGVPLIALGREIIVEPDWVAKIADSREEEIRTTISKEDQEQLVIPDPLWSMIMNRPGWFPVEEASVNQV